MWYCGGGTGIRPETRSVARMTKQDEQLILISIILLIAVTSAGLIVLRQRGIL